MTKASTLLGQVLGNHPYAWKIGISALTAAAIAAHIVQKAERLDATAASREVSADNCAAASAFGNMRMSLWIRFAST